MRHLVLFSAVCVAAVTTAANAGTMSAFDSVYDAAPGTAEAYYNPWTGDLSFDVGTGVAVVGISAPVIYHDAVERLPRLGAPGQNANNVLAYFNTSGLATGLTYIGSVLPQRLCYEDIFFSYTPVGQPTVAARVIGPIHTPECIPEPSTLALFGIGVFGLLAYRRRRRKA